MHLTCVISEGWLCCADLKPSSQGWYSGGLIWSGLVQQWLSDLNVGFSGRVSEWSGVVSDVVVASKVGSNGLV